MSHHVSCSQGVPCLHVRLSSVCEVSAQAVSHHDCWLQVANHMLGTRISKRSGNEDITVIMDDGGNDSPHASDGYEVDTSRHRLLDGNQTSDSSDLMAIELESQKPAKHGPGRGPRQLVQADGTLRHGPAAFSSRQSDRLQAVELSDMPLKAESRTTSSLGLGMTPSSSQQDLAMQRQHYGESPRHNVRSGSRMMPSTGSFDDFGEQPRQDSGSVPPSPLAAAPQASPFQSTLQQFSAVPDPAAPSAGQADEQHPLDRSHSMHSGRITRWWGKFDAQYMQPVFGGPAPPAPFPDSGPQAVSDPNAPTEARPRS